MAGDEHQAEQVVANFIFDRCVEIRHGRLLLSLQLAAELFVLGLQPLVSPPQIDGAMFRRGHEPGARIVRDARLRPLFERGDESVLRQLFGKAHVAHDARESGDDPGGLHPPDRFDNAMGIAGGHEKP